MTALLERTEPASSFRNRKWRKADRDPDVLRELVSAGVDEVVAKIVASRGISPADALSFVDPKLKNDLPDPFRFKDMERAARRLAKAIENKEPVAIWSDYDVDGATASAVLARYLSMMGCRCRIYIPDRIEEGYGPNIAGMRELRDEGYSFVCILDSGTTAFSVLGYADGSRWRDKDGVEAETIHDLGMEVVVIDHHQADRELGLPGAIAVINPNRADEDGRYGYLCAAGMTFLVCYAVQMMFSRQGYFEGREKPDLMSMLDIVALGTVADVVPLRGLNRAYVRTGLKVMDRRINPGLTALMNKAGVKGVPESYTCSFVLGPRINAGGRVDDAGMGARLLTSVDPVECATLAAKLDSSNVERRAIEDLVLQEAREQVLGRPKGRLVYAVGETWHEGVIGIIAGRLKEQHDAPSLVFTRTHDGNYKASGRSLPGFDLGAAVIAARHAGLLVAGGGHGAAAGLTVKPERLDELLAFLDREIENSDLARLGVFTDYDLKLSPKAIKVSLVRKFALLEPYGQGNPKPRILIEALKVVRVDYLTGKVAGIKLTLEHRDGKLKGVVFRENDTPLGKGLAESQDTFLDVVATLKINDYYQDNPTVDLMIEDARPSGITDSLF